MFDMLTGMFGRMDREDSCFHVRACVDVVRYSNYNLPAFQVFEYIQRWHQ